MARGCLFEMEKNLENVRTASESSFYDLAEHEFAFIQTCTEDERREHIRQFLEYMEKIGIETGTMDTGDCQIPYFIVTDDGKRRYFAQKLDKLKEEVSNMTLEDFLDCWISFPLESLIDDDWDDKLKEEVSNMTLEDFLDRWISFPLESLIDGDWDDAVTMQEYTFQSMDHFFRTADGQYFIGSVFYMH